jgi:hypothetical protein
LCDKPHHLKECPFLDECRDFVKKKLSATAMHTQDRHRRSFRFEDDYFGSDNEEANLLYLCKAKPSTAMIADDRCVPLQIDSAANDGKRKKNMNVLLDSQANVSVFCEASLLGSIREAPTAIIVEGIAGDMIVNQIGDHPDFGTVFFNPAAPANLLCQFDMVRHNGCKITLEAESHRYTLKSKSGRIYIFEEKNKLSICKCPPASSYRKPSNPICATIGQLEMEKVVNLVSPSVDLAVNFPSKSPEIKTDQNVQNGGDDDKEKVLNTPVIKKDVEDDFGWTVVKTKSRPRCFNKKSFSSKSMAKKKPLVTKTKDHIIALKKIVSTVEAPNTSR